MEMITINQKSLVNARREEKYRGRRGIKNFT
jgi:hypothetical protein